MNQRRGKTHAAGGADNGQTVNLQVLIRTIRDCQAALEAEGEEDSALRFEVFGDYLVEDVAAKAKPITFHMRMLGL